MSEKDRRMFAARIKLYFVPVSLLIENEVIHTHLGFGGNLPHLFLGQKGFFDKFKEITFRHPKFVELKIR